MKLVELQEMSINVLHIICFCFVVQHLTGLVSTRMISLSLALFDYSVKFQNCVDISLTVKEVSSPASLP